MTSVQLLRVLGELEARRESKKLKRGDLVNIVVDAVRTLAICRMLGETDKKEMATKEILEHFGVNDKSGLFSSIQATEKQFFGGEAFLERGSGRKTIAVPKDEVKRRRFQSAIEGLETWVYMTLNILGVGVEPLIEVGVGVSLTAYHAWIAARAYLRETKDDVDIRITHGLPQDLKEKGDSGQLDIVVTSWEHTDQVRKTFEFPARLMVERRHSFRNGIPADPRQRWDLLASKRLMLQRGRSPRIEFDFSRLPKSCQIIYASSWPEAFASVLASSNTFCIGLPDVLPARERTRFREIELDGLNPLTVAVKTYARTGPWTAEPCQVDGLARAFERQLHHMTDDTNDCDKMWPGDDVVRTAHTTYGPDDGQCWVHGVIENCIVTPQGRIRGDHKIRKSKVGRRLDLTFDGIMTHDPQTDRYYINWRAWERGNAGPESYVVFFCASRDDFKAMVFGTWSGRATWSAAAYQTVGLFVVYSGSQLHDNELTDRTRDWLMSHQVELGRPFGELLVSEGVMLGKTDERRAEIARNPR